MGRKANKRFVHIDQSNSGVGTVAAVAALAVTLFSPYINIHNTIFKVL